MKKIFSSRVKASNKLIDKYKIPELKLSSEENIRAFKFKLRGHRELSKEQNIVQLIILLYTLNGINPFISGTFFLSEETKVESMQIIKKIIELMKKINIFLFYFKHYKIEEKIIQKIIPNFKYNFYKKDELVFKEGDPSNRFYFLMKGKISFRKKTLLVDVIEPQMIEKFSLGEGSHFGEWDIIYERKKKTSAVCIEDSHIVSVDRETFKDFFESRVTKVESEVKNMIKNFLMKYMTLPAIKIERFIQTDIKTLFFKRNEVIYREGDNNCFLFMINNGEANLIQNFSKGEYSFLMKYQYPSEYIKNLARRIDYKGVIRNAFSKKEHLDYFNNTSNLNQEEKKEEKKEEEQDEDKGNKEIKENKENVKKSKLIKQNKENEKAKNKDKTTDNKKNNKNNNEETNKETDNNLNVDKNKDEDILDKSSESLKLDLLLDRKTYQNIVILNKGSVGGLEICTGITKFKYSLISNSDFTSVFKIDLRQLDGEHLTEFMLNLLPLFIDFERKIHLQIKKLKYFDANLLPETCQKYNKKSNVENYYFKEEENDQIYIKNIQKIDGMFQFNEGGFIKMNPYNLNLHRKKNELKELLKENSRRDKRANSFLQLYVNEQNSKLKFRGMKKLIPVIPNYEIIDNRFDIINRHNEDNEKESDIRPSGIYYSLVNGKNCFYLIDNNLLSGKSINKSKHLNKNDMYSKKYQEMFDKLQPKSKFSRNNNKNKRITSLKLYRLKNKKINYRKMFVNDNNYMRDLMIQKNKTSIHCFDANLFKLKNKTEFSKSAQKSNELSDRMNTLNYNNKKLTFYDTGKYDIPLLTEINN